MADSDPRFLKASTVYQSGRITIVKEEFSLPTGEVIERGKLHHPGAAVIIPRLPDGRLVLVEQYRYPLKKRILEFPAGTVDNSEEHLKTATRELREEIGGVSDNLVFLGSDYSTPGFTDEQLHSYLADNVRLGVTALELGELLSPVIMSVSEVEGAIKDGKLQDMKSIVALTRARFLVVL